MYIFHPFKTTLVHLFAAYVVVHVYEVSASERRVSRSADAGL
ncbi:hypothetical protein SNOG_09945 [Parastagonospora nodorum SN15]|uniref:Uncharacterized protein n=1 Tax=Phaeosphaeria nodorum (strain SN15 / ATCC MYA-4574 / FGSC 10173) TaxID=321614 RepID=Q0UE69_PHANO|nr:hypothetical protein SNOG_09945 [Parastagonospora nodorum SN15]EAT82280.1 hypothetical protein SNOG_09945 [Parastagonospora nodorum SN15]